MSEQITGQEFISLIEGICNRVIDQREQVKAVQPVVPDESDEAKEMLRICSLEYLNRREVAIFFSVSDGTVDNLIADDPTFPVSKVTKSTPRFRRVDLIEWARDRGRRRLRQVG